MTRERLPNRHSAEIVAFDRGGFRRRAGFAPSSSGGPGNAFAAEEADAAG
jgi:hypothetical protein